MSFGIWELVIVLVIVVLLFGTKKLKTLGGDLGSAIKGFRKAIGNEESADPVREERVIEGEVESSETKSDRT